MPQEITTVPIGDLEPHPANPRQGDVGLIHSLIEENGWYGVIVAQRSTGRILAGNHRWRAAKAAGMSELPVAYLDVDDDRAERILLADNRSNDLASYDDHALADLLQSLTATTSGLLGTGWDGDDLDQLLADLNGDQPTGPLRDPEPSVPEQAQERWHVEPGDVWQAGEQTVICGDASDQGLYAMISEPPRLIVTSPPYNQKLDTFKGSGMHKDNSFVERMAVAYEDSMPEAEYQSQQAAVIGLLHDIAAPDASLFYNHKHRYRDTAVVTPLAWLIPSPWTLRQEIIWDRAGSITLNARMFMPVDERIYWLRKGDQFVFNDDAETKAWGSVWRITPKNEIKATAPFPVELPGRCIQACSEPGDMVLDPYGGAGTTVVAAHQLERCGVTIERHPPYVAVILDRLQALGLEPAKHG